MSNQREYLPIEDYGLIGNLHTTALVSKQGSIDFLPYTRFDSPTIFGSILDRKKGGHFSIEVADQEANHKQLYLPDTAVLLTRYLTNDGIAELTDFMPPHHLEGRFVLVRKLKVIKGAHTFRVELKPRFDYGKHGFLVKKDGDNLILENKHSAKQAFRLIADSDFHEEDESLIAEVQLETKDELTMVLVAEDGKEPVGKNLIDYSQTSFDDTVRFWRNWVKQAENKGRWQDIVNRSAITLKLMTSYRYGSTVAAATFGLPEQVGGERNWDYRFTWIRDTAFTMYSFLELGYHGEARKFIEWIQQRSLEISSAEELKLMYRVDGSTDLTERELSHLDGYKKSTPVRVGNGAYDQFQLDIYGELIDTIYIYNKNAEPISYDFWQSLMKFIDFVCENWKKKDRGIWEVRDDKREFLISKVMSWVALDRGILIAEDRSFPAPIDRWRKTRNEIYNDVFFNYWNPIKKAFVQYRGGDSLDASALLIPLVRMLSPKEPRWVSTLKALEQELITDALVYRYRLDEGASDGFKSEEGTFSMCSFWYIECLAKAGELDRAILAFEKMLGYSNHVGLFAEQISLRGELLGNFPQAFTHLGLISAANRLRLLMRPGNTEKPSNKDN
ncbi:MAG TPA: glycoside hydrolase family 15 protein [Sunxiuqinia sp.]|nr:glycoside hydrolase family 15 protein [Sunxiuqinia sp.]